MQKWFYPVHFVLPQCKVGLQVCAYVHISPLNTFKLKLRDYANCDSWAFFFFFHSSCRLLHLAIIHEDTHIAQELIQLFPKEVLDIQNNLYQVSSELGIFQPGGLPHY